MTRRILDAGRLLRLKEHRLDAARRALATAAGAVRAAEAQVAVRDAAIAALDHRRAGFDVWLSDPPADVRMIEAALVCREQVVRQREEQLAARLDDVAALQAAEAERAEAARQAARAEARRDAAQQMLARFTQARAVGRDRRAEQEIEERLRGAGALA